MINYRRILELTFSGTSQRTIESLVGSSRHTIREVVERAEARDLSSLEDEMTNQWLETFLFPEKTPVAKGYYQEDWEYVHKELGKKHMSLTLLHKEYKDRAKEDGLMGYSYRSYCRFYGDYARKYKVTMPLKRKPGEILEVDWAGATLSLKDLAGGPDIDVYLFVACLPFSQHFYVEGFLDMTSPSWLTAHIHAFEYFNGVPELLSPDNLKTGIQTPNYAEPKLNAAYQDLADYYGTVVVPARVEKPKDKPSVESSVGLASRQIIAALRNVQCFYLHELNELIFQKLEEITTAPFQKKLGSRQSVFEEEEWEYLTPVRQPRFQLTDWRVAKVQTNYHIQVDKNYYSVPYEYIQSQVEVRLTQDLLEVYFNQGRIASHKRIHGDIGIYSTNKDHMPDHHRLYLDHTPDSSRNWAQTIGPATQALIDKILAQQVEKRALRMIAGIQRLKEQHSLAIIEQTSEILLDIAKQPTLSTFKQIIKEETNRPTHQEAVQQKQDEQHGFVRGADYFGRKK
ncbi:IS21 family transposase [Globicatella sanguinis]|uniref:IS21 family transposase n=1 Tax=Globicatella sanguinis TaxID=13076 RepID=UPI0025438D6E|nr:IS21 family transposase [Globicatella sanguinis]WIK66141.1 IS21 family transposase [Globicatella sanguinis]WKT55546.1 IS21 family transposase [Globicatella sanguinis]